MIIVELKGGFGNQLFQYAAGLSLAQKHGVEIKVDTSSFINPDDHTGTQRQHDIFNLVDKPVEATTKELEYYSHLSKLIVYKEKLLPFYKRKIYKEESFTFDKNFFKAGSNLYLKGNRQSEQYFKPYESYIRNKFALAENAITSVKDFGQRLVNQNSVSIHIRRGDYLTPIALEWLGLIPISHYNECIKLIAQKIPDSTFYLFSDDMEWVKENLKIEHEHVFVSNIITKNPMEDFYLMSCCKHNIIANSSFSWWAAWLNNNPDKIVIAPKKWFNNHTDPKDLIPESWMKV